MENDEKNQLYLPIYKLRENIHFRILAIKKTGNQNTVWYRQTKFILNVFKGIFISTWFLNLMFHILIGDNNDYIKAVVTYVTLALLFFIHYYLTVKYKRMYKINYNFCENLRNEYVKRRLIIECLNEKISESDLQYTNLSVTYEQRIQRCAKEKCDFDKSIEYPHMMKSEIISKFNSLSEKEYENWKEEENEYRNEYEINTDQIGFTLFVGILCSNEN